MDPVVLFSYVPSIAIFVFLAALVVAVAFLLKTVRRSKEYVEAGHFDTPTPSIKNVLANKKVLPVVILIVILLIGLGVSFVLVRNQQSKDLRGKAACGNQCYYDCLARGYDPIDCDLSCCSGSDQPPVEGCTVWQCDGQECKAKFSNTCSGQNCDPNDPDACKPVSEDDDTCKKLGELCNSDYKCCEGLQCSSSRVCAATINNTCDRSGVKCEEDDKCCSKVCRYGSCYQDDVSVACGSFGEIECWTHNNCYWNGASCIPRPSTLPTGNKVTCNGATVVNNTGSNVSCTASYFSCAVKSSSAAECNANPFCGGNASSASNNNVPSGSSWSVPVNLGVSSIACGVWQYDYIIDCGSAGSCSGANSGCNWDENCEGKPTPTPSGPSCNQACTGTGQGNCPSGLQCLSGTCQNPSCLGDADCVCGVNNAACNSVVADKTLSTLKVGDTVTFTGYGWVSAATDTIDLINFIISRDGTEVVNTNITAVRAPEKDVAGNYYFKASYSYTVPSSGNYQVKVRAHWVQGNVWKD